MDVKDVEQNKKINLSLRLPEDYHRQLQMQADRRGESLHSQILYAIRRHLAESGYAPNVIKSSATGRLFEIEVEPMKNLVENEFIACRFDVRELNPLYEKRRAFYVIGIHENIADDYQLKEPHIFVRELGLALLARYNRAMMEIDQIAWDQRGDDQHRFFLSPDFESKPPEAFLVRLAKDAWNDPHVCKTGESQDLLKGRRKESDLYTR